MMEQGYSRSHSHHCVYFKRLDNGRYIILLLYVDDLLLVASNIEDINVLKWKLAKSFVIKDLSVAKQILGMRITRDRKNHNLTLSQGEHIEKVFEIFKLQNAKPLSTPFVDHFKQSKETCPIASQSRGRDRIYVQGSVFISSLHLDVCHGVHKTRYCACNGSCEKVYKKSW